MAPLDPAAELDDLFGAYPLPSRFERPEAFIGSATIQGLLVHIVGLSTRAENGDTVTGSAGDVLGVPLSRSYFELLERSAVLEALRQPEPSYAVRNAQGALLGSATRELVFPTEPAGAAWRYSKSNGVAAGASWERACRAAAAELVERDHVLRAWYGQTAPRRVAMPVSSLLRNLSEVYEIEAYAFPSDCRAEKSARLVVAGVFGFPKLAAVPLVFGTGAADCLDEALGRATREMIQRLGFLWGEHIPDRVPDSTPTADYHQEYYLVPRMHDRLRAWLGGEHCRRGSLLEPRQARSNPIRFIELTPGHLLGRFWVAKAISEGKLPLAFGPGHPCLNALDEHCRVHPLA